MATPNWSKLPPLIEDLLANAPGYALFQALAVVEHAWSERGQLGNGLDRWLRMEPYAGLSFPASDLRRGHIDAAGVLRLTANVHGLYGVDAPMPHYVLEAAGRDDEAVARMRTFLDIFNHRLYSLLYQAWKVQNAVDGGAGAYGALAQAMAGGVSDDRLAHAGSITRRRPSAAALATMLEADLGVAVAVADGIAQWLPVLDRPALGSAEAPCLGGDALLGDGVQVAGERIDVRIGPLPLAEALALLPGTTRGERLLTLVGRLLGADLPFDLILRVHPGEARSRALGGEDLPLGWSSWLRERVDQYIDISITAGRERPATDNRRNNRDGSWQPTISAN